MSQTEVPKKREVKGKKGEGWIIPNGEGCFTEKVGMGISLYKMRVDIRRMAAGGGREGPWPAY